jgi:nucleotide-binding universal stress UspA family protein
MNRSKTWTGFRSVLCPIDFSPHSREALRYAEAIALRGKAVLQVVYVNDTLLVAAAAAALHDRHLAARSARELRDFVAATLTAGSKKRLRLTSHVSTGHPAGEILRTAASRGTDLIVLGTHGLSGVNRLMMGSTTLTVLQRTTVPVLAIPHAEGRPAIPFHASWPERRIVAAIELNGEHSADAARAARIAQWFGSSLLLVHVVTQVPRPAWLRGDFTAHDRTRLALATRRLGARAAIAQRSVPTDFRVLSGDISNEIAALAVTEHVELLITALHDRRGWFGTKRGSISYHVLSNAVAPVMALPRQWRLG